jgi:hypothetical protein
VDNVVGVIGSAELLVQTAGKSSLYSINVNKGRVREACKNVLQASDMHAIMTTR